MSTGNNVGAWALIGAGVVGAVVAATVFIVERILAQRQYQHKSSVEAQLRTEILHLRRELRALDKKCTKKSRRSTGSTNSVPDTSEDEVFYDVSDTDDWDGPGYDQLLAEIEEQLADQTFEVVDLQLQRLKRLAEQLAPLIINGVTGAVTTETATKVYWLIGRAHFKVQQALANERSRTDTQALHERLVHIDDGLIACERALQLDARCGFAHKYAAILLGIQINENEELSQAQPPPPPLTKQLKCQLSNRYKEHLELAMELRPNDPDLHYMLARFYYEWAALSWWERNGAAMLGAQIPKLASFEEAHECALRCDRFLRHNQPQSATTAAVWKPNKLMLAKCKWQMGDKDAAIRWLQEIADMEMERRGDLSESQVNRQNDRVDEEIEDLWQKLSL